jgi:predicted nucleic acid-binding protein
MPSCYYLDTSALLPRFLRRALGHTWVRGICVPSSLNVIAIAEITEAELAAPLNQLARGRVIRKKTADEALVLFWDQIDAGAYRIIPIISTLVRRAADLCGNYALKGYDAIQLACARATREVQHLADADRAARGGPIFGDPIFDDKRLADAATAEGFVVDTSAAHP